jgi:CRISPR-associated RAMP protein (TIGR02581 family)
MNNLKHFQTKVKIGGTLTFDTAFHIGSGKEGELATNMGVMIEADGSPILPGSTLKGCFRATAERLAAYLGLNACLLDHELSGANCFTGLKQEEQKVRIEMFREKAEAAKIQWLEDNTCDICRLFGSPLQSSRIFFSDGKLITWSNSLQIRNGVCIDRDSETARPGALYDFEVVPAGASFGIGIELENPTEKELAIVAAVLTEWEEGFRLGGFTSRGLGRAKFQDRTVHKVDYTDPDQLKSYLLKREMQMANNVLPESLERILNNPGGDNA